MGCQFFKRMGTPTKCENKCRQGYGCLFAKAGHAEVFLFKKNPQHKPPIPLPAIENAITG
jgi:hypothetical protein